ncbi:MAG TPA: tRNA lysidine(34) synthetase TilS, partial [Tenericutes bacterium]|nr:tRNA lysidine(34) synthetase TilS [Mycoplasmatota bacterium]
DIKEFLKEDVVIQKKVLYIILSMKNEEIVNKITNKHIDSLLELASSKRANAYVMLPFVTVRKVYDKIVFDSKDKDDIEYNYELGNKIKIVNGKTIEMVDVAPDNSNNTLTLLREEISFPLYVRTRKEGDRIKVKGMDGTKKVKDIFIDEKISLKERESWPIVVDSSGNILWIPGLKKSCFDKGKNGKYNVVLIYY